MNNHPFFPQWQARLAAFRRCLLPARSRPLRQLQALFGPWLPHPRLAPTASGPNSRQRLFSMPVTFWVFLWQCFQPDGCCRSAVQQMRAGLCGHDPAVSLDEDSRAYCQARQRWPLDRLAALRQDAAATAQQHAPPFSWCSHPVKIIDGSTASLPDTAANQQAYPQSQSQ